MLSHLDIPHTHAYGWLHSSHIYSLVLNAIAIVAVWWCLRSWRVRLLEREISYLLIATMIAGLLALITMLGLFAALPNYIH